MSKFRKKPVVIDAVKWTGFNCVELVNFNRGGVPFDFRTDNTLGIETLEGTMTADPGDWIIRGVKGEVYPCKPDIFELTYEPA